MSQVPWSECSGKGIASISTNIVLLPHNLRQTEEIRRRSSDVTICCAEYGARLRTKNYLNDQKTALQTSRRSKEERIIFTLSYHPQLCHKEYDSNELQTHSIRLLYKQDFLTTMRTRQESRQNFTQRFCKTRPTATFFPVFARLITLSFHLKLTSQVQIKALFDWLPLSCNILHNFQSIQLMLCTVETGRTSRRSLPQAFKRRTLKNQQQRNMTVCGVSLELSKTENREILDSVTITYFFKSIPFISSPRNQRTPIIIAVC